MEKIPQNAVGIKVSCPKCGKKPVVSAAKAYGVTGMILAYRRSTHTVIGCRDCIKTELLSTVGRNLVLGWWSPTAAIINPFATIYNLINAVIPRNGPNNLLMETLDELGAPCEFLLKNEIFNAKECDIKSILYASGIINLACAMMMADEKVSPEEEKIIYTIANKTFPDYPNQKIQQIINKIKNAPNVDISKICRRLESILTDDGKEMVLRFMVAIAAADGKIEKKEIESVTKIASSLGIPQERVKGIIGT